MSFYFFSYKPLLEIDNCQIKVSVTNSNLYAEEQRKTAISKKVMALVTFIFYKRFSFNYIQQKAHKDTENSTSLCALHLYLSFNLLQSHWFPLQACLATKIGVGDAICNLTLSAVISLYSSLGTLSSNF